MDKSLKLIKTTKKNQSNADSNFWKCCPLKLEYLPTKACQLGNPINGEPKCAWWINSPEHKFCFWSFVRDKSNTDGQMKELVQTDLARLFGWSNTKAHFILKEAMSKLLEIMKEHDALEDFEDIVDDHLDDIIVPVEGKDI